MQQAQGSLKKAGGSKQQGDGSERQGQPRVNECRASLSSADIGGSEKLGFERGASSVHNATPANSRSEHIKTGLYDINNTSESL